MNLTDDFNKRALKNCLSAKSLNSNISIKKYNDGSVIDANCVSNEETIFKNNYKGYSGKMMRITNKDRTYFVHHG